MVSAMPVDRLRGDEINRSATHVACPFDGALGRGFDSRRLHQSMTAGRRARRAGRRFFQGLPRRKIRRSRTELVFGTHGTHRMARRLALVLALSASAFVPVSIGCSIAPERAKEDLSRVIALEPARWSDEWSDSDWIERVAALESGGEDRAIASATLRTIAERHPSPSVRIAALEALVPLGQDDDRAPALKAALSDQNAAVRARAAAMALSIAGPSVRADYARLLAASEPAAVKRAALIELTAAPPSVDTEPDLTARVVDCAFDIDPGVRFHACAVLAKAAPDGPVDADPRVAPDAWRAWWRGRAVRGTP